MSSAVRGAGGVIFVKPTFMSESETFGRPAPGGWREHVQELALIAALIVACAVAVVSQAPSGHGAASRQDQLRHCLKITDNLARLTCYDNLANVQYPAKGGAPLAIHPESARP